VKLNKFSKIIFFPLIIGAVFAIFLVPDSVSAASLFLSPSTGTYSVGSNFSVKLMVGSSNETINASEGILGFDKDLLDVVSVSKSGSIFSLWTTEPSFSNSTGVISFGGGTPQGFLGNSGTLITITFRVKAAGNSPVTISSASVLAADFKGTNVLASMTSGNYALVPKTVTPPVSEYVPPKNSPGAVIINSTTHPDQSKWYINGSPRLTWKNTSDATGVRLLIDRNPLSTPTVPYSGQLEEKQLEDLNDGIWYFHVQLQNSYGWGWIAHYKIQIDEKAPNPFEISSKEGSEAVSSQPTLIFAAQDETSGVDHYEILVDQNPLIQTKESEYKFSQLDPGKHTIIVKAVDKAGNTTLALKEINISSIEPPVIIEYQQELAPNSILVLKGTSLSEITIKIYLQNSKQEIKIGETKSDKDGKWLYAGMDPLESGAYKIWTESIDSSGNKSQPSDTISILVTVPSFIKIGQLAIDYLVVIITLLILISVVIFMALWIWKKLKMKQKKVHKETIEAEKAVYVAFKELREKVRKQAEKLDDQKGLSEKEKKIYIELKKALDDSEKLIDKEVKDIKEEADK
jgi:hypothetical protein